MNLYYVYIFFTLLFEATSPPVDGALGQRLVPRAAMTKIGPIAQRSNFNYLVLRTDVNNARFYFSGVEKYI